MFQFLNRHLPRRRVLINGWCFNGDRRVFTDSWGCTALFRQKLIFVLRGGNEMEQFWPYFATLCRIMVINVCIWRSMGLDILESD